MNIESIIESNITGTDSSEIAISKRSKAKIYNYCSHYDSAVTAHEVIMGEPNYLGYHWKLGRQLPTSFGAPLVSKRIVGRSKLTASSLNTQSNELSKKN